MAQEEPNPLLGHVMGVLEGRQQTELAKLTILTEIARMLGDVAARLAAIEKHLAEQAERKGR